MNDDQKFLLRALVDVQSCIRAPTFTEDRASYDNLSYYFDLLVDSYRRALGNKQIKEFLDE